MDNLSLSVAPLLICFVIMTAAYFVALRLKLFSLVDVVWSYLFTVVAWIYCSSAIGGSNFRNKILLAMVVFWSVRLGTHIMTRLMKHYPEEDTRYKELREKWSRHLKFNFLVFFLFQGLSVAILATPFLLIATNPSESMNWVEWLGIFVWAVGVSGESLADRQLSRFRALPDNKGKVCEVGLWRFSRHPNYFCEWLLWVGYFIFALPSPQGYMAFVSPAVMLYLLVKVTGVPYAEASSLRSRGDLYRDYQRRVSKFVPWWPKNKMSSLKD